MFLPFIVGKPFVFIFMNLKFTVLSFATSVFVSMLNSLLKLDEIFKFQVKLPNHFTNRISQQSSFEMFPAQETISTKLYVGRVWNTLTEKDIFDVLDAEAKKLSPLAKVSFL